jgi:hypothetical protein
LIAKSTILRAGITAFASLLLLSSCGTLRDRSDLPYVIDDQAGGYRSKIPGLLAEAEKLAGKKWKGKKIVIFKPENLDVRSVSDLVARLKMNREEEGTIAWTAYDDKSGTAFVQPMIAKPPRWAMVHEFGHVVLLSNDIDGHPNKYASKFKYW